MAEKRNIFLVGPMGAGKSTIGRQLAQLLGMDFIDTDTEIEQRAGADISWIFDVEGEEGFRKREERIINELTQKQGIVLSTGGGAVMSKENRNHLSARGIVIYLETTVDKQFERTQRDKNARYCKMWKIRVKCLKNCRKSAIHFIKKWQILPCQPMIKVRR